MPDRSGQGGDYGVGDVARGRVASQVGSAHQTCDEYLFHRSKNSAGGVPLANRFQEIHGRQQQRQRIGAAHSDGFAAAAVKRFVDAYAVAHVNSGRGADSSANARAQVADKVAVQVPHHQHVELLRPQHHWHAAIVHYDLARLELGKVLGGGAEDFQEQAVRQLEDVGLVDTAHRFPPRRPGPLEGKPEEAPAGDLRDHLDALDDSRHDFVLDGGVQVFGELANHQQVYTLEARRQTFQVLERANGGVQAEQAAKLDVVIDVGRSGGRQQLGLESQAGLADRADHLFRESRAV